MEAFEYQYKSNMESRPEPLHTTKLVKIAIKKEQQLIQDLELKAKQLEGTVNFQSSEERGDESSKRLKLQMDAELFQVKREIRLRKCSLQVARGAFAQFMLAGDEDEDHDEVIDLSHVVSIARKTCLDETDTEVSEGELKKRVESMLEILGLYVKQVDNWNFQIGFLMNQEIEV